MLIFPRQKSQGRHVYPLAAFQATKVLDGSSGLSRVGGAVMVDESPLPTRLLGVEPGVRSLQIEQLTRVVVAVYIESLIVI